MNRDTLGRFKKGHNLAKSGPENTQYGKRPWNWSNLFINCLICNKVFHTPPRSIKKGMGKYCSKKCASISFKGKHHSPNSEFKKGQMAKSKHPLWIKNRTKALKNRADRRGPDYYYWRKAVLAKFKYTCQKCGISNPEVVAHHIKSFAKFSNLRFSTENGTVLCLQCHDLIHSIKRRKFRSRF